MYIFLLAGVARHLYYKPIYSMDSIQYMGNALLMEEHDPVPRPASVWRSAAIGALENAARDSLGYEVGAPANLKKITLLMRVQCLHIREFLPLFAIRPLYNQTLWLVSKTGLGLVRSGLLISVTSYFLPWSSSIYLAWKVYEPSVYPGVFDFADDQPSAYGFGTGNNGRSAGHVGSIRIAVPDF